MLKISENLRDIVDKIVEIESTIHVSHFLSTEYPENKKYSEEYQNETSQLSDLYKKIDEIQKDYEMLKFKNFI